jgi:hypothetical protein
MKMTSCFAAILTIMLALFSGSAFAEGAEFFDNPFVGVFQPDGEGNTCTAVNNPPTNEFNNFLRQNPNGETLLKFVDQGAAITITTASGEVFAGVGRYTATFHGFGGGAKNVGTQFSATAEVTNGVIFARAVCKFTRDAKGIIRVNKIELH